MKKRNRYRIYPLLFRTSYNAINNYRIIDDSLSQKNNIWEVYYET